MKYTMSIFCVSLCIFAILPSVFSMVGINRKQCRQTPSLDAVGEVDVICSCMETIMEIDAAINTLYINQTGCEDKLLTLSWSTLQTFVGVSTVVFENATLSFTPDKTGRMEPSITNLIFINCFIKTICKDAFYGLNIIEKIDIRGTKIGIISSGAFNAFNQLKTVEFSDSAIGTIETNAFAELPLLEDLAFIRCAIDLIESNSIYILNEELRKDFEECPESINRARSENFNYLMGLSGRSLASFDSNNLPERGNRLFIFNTQIGFMSSRSIVTNGFSYIIFGGNTISWIESNAIEAELYNQCDISALLIIKNSFNLISSKAFEAVKGSPESYFSAFVAFTENVFDEVANGGFLLNLSLQVFTANQNRFSCSCEKFSWISSSEFEKADNQKVFEESMVESSFCSITNTPLANFLKLCLNFVYEEVTSDPVTVTNITNEMSTPNEDNEIYIDLTPMSHISPNETSHSENEISSSQNLVYNVYLLVLVLIGPLLKV